ncbi:RHS repeat-associated core domain-containing protein [Streptomyces sp. NPDC005388]|uniref:RHS repeat-associated core domain-containing protein n=1 Tax=Streptomyces sp. NPDC005388 TaxID=3156717 RepID=UPI0033ABE587
MPKTLSFATGYNLDGTVDQSAAPAVAGLAAETVKYGYNSTGQQLTSRGTTGYLQGAKFSPQGDLNQLTLGMDGSSSAKKVFATWLYEEGTRRLTQAQVTDDVHSYPAQDLNFKQDDAGNVTSIFDTTTQGGSAKADYQCFAYDGYSRMTEAWTPKSADCAATGRAMSNVDGPAPYWTSYTYNAGGQRQTETQHATSGDKTTTYKYDDTTDNKPHTLDKTTGATTGSYVYDSTGNTITRPGPAAQQTLAWNTEGKLAGLTEGTKETSYLYDANGELLIRRAKGDGDTVLYLGGGTEARLTVKGTTKTLSGTRYYAANGQTIACRTAVSGTTGTKLSFLAGDHHGTSSVVLDASTYAITKRYSSPFGGSRGTKATTWPDDKAFLGKPADASTALTHVGAREYDPSIGQFISVDPVLSVDQHQSLNGYSYAGNSPVTQSDPTGLQYPADQGSSGGANGTGCYFVLQDPCGGVTTKPGGSGGAGGSGCYYVLTDACGTSGGGGGGGTARTNSSGHTSSGKSYSCSGVGPAEMCRPNTGPQDTRTDAGNYLGSLLSNSDFWSGLIQTAAGAFGEAGGGLLVVSGAVECGTGILCPVGAPSVAGGAGLAAAGVPLIQSGSDKLGRAFREADSASAGGAEVNWNSNSVKTFGHTFKDHGSKKSLQWLADRARGKGVPVGQWLDDSAAAQLMRENHRGLTNPKDAYTIKIPEGLGRVVSEDGSYVPATHAVLVPSRSGFFKSAYPVVLG